MSVYRWCKLFDQSCSFLRAKSLGGNQSLKLRWIRFEWLSVAVHTNQLGTLPKN
jgi:hypothetical protein